VDETTYMFSPKVLDRANVIEFRVGPKEMKAFLANPGTKPDLRKLAGEGSGYGKAFVTTQAAEVKVASEFSEAINKFFEILGNQDLEFGYRVAHEASRLVHFQKLLGSGSFRPNFDAVIAQKLLPKLHGSRSQLETLLQELLLATSGKAEEDWNEEVLETENPQYPLSFNKLKRMYKKLQRDQFVSFAEA
jgi:5-methylcytosine-specific restriction protein B